MKSSDKDRLRQLLVTSARAGDEVLDACKEAAATYGLLDYRLTRQVPKQEVVYIYSIRARQKNSPARGFTKFLQDLGSAKDTHVRLHSFTVKDDHFLIATDAATTRVIATLAVDLTGRRSAKWYPENKRLFGNSVA